MKYAQLAQVSFLALCVYVAPTSPAWSLTEVFWTDLGADTLYHGYQETGNIEQLLRFCCFVNVQLEGIATDGSALYFADSLGDRIVRTNFDGSEFTTLLRFPDQGGFSSLFQGLAIEADSMYWADSFRDSIYMANLDGSEVNLLVSLDAAFGSGFYSPTAVDTYGQQVFWAELSGGIYRADSDGSNPIALIPFDGELPHTTFGVRGLAVSDTGLFWTDFRNDLIYRSELDGSAPEIVVDLVATFGAGEYEPRGITSSGDSLYWTDGAQDAIFRHSLRDNNSEIIFSYADTRTVIPNYVLVLPQEVPEPTAISLLMYLVPVLLSCRRIEN